MKHFPFAVLVLLARSVTAAEGNEGSAPPIDFTAPVLNLAHNPAATEPANPRNLLTTHRDRSWLENHLVQGTKWVPYPTIEDRAGWAQVPADVRRAIIESAEQVKDKPWAQLTATLALNYWRNGNRSEYGNLRAERQSRLQKLTLAEVVQAQGRFLDPIADAIWLTCEETYWGEPAHIPQMQRSGGGLPNVEEPTIELFAAERGAALAWTSYLLGARLDTVSPWLQKRIKYEIERRILTPFLARNDFWWMGMAERKDLNNWTPWIVSNVLTCALLMEDDAPRRVAIVEKCLQIMDRYLNSYPADGGCDVGPSYWQAAVGSTFDCLELLGAATGGALVVYDDPLVRKMAHFTCDSHVAGDWVLNFGDGSARSRPSASLVYRFGKKTDDPVMMAFGGWLAHREKLTETLSGNLNRQLPALFGREELLAAKAAEPLARDVYLPNLQLVAARDAAGQTGGFYFGVRGYFNAKSHNHNDAGSFMLYLDGQPILIDVGVEVYTTKTFSPQRYDIWTMQSAYHNLPTINGQMQGWGRQYEATGLSYLADNSQASVTMDLAKAYPAAAGIESWKRTLVLVRGKNVTLTDTHQLKSVQAPLIWNFMTTCRIDTSQRGRLILTYTAPEAAGPPTATVTMAYDADRLTPRVEEITTTDGNLRPVWGGVIRRIQFVEEKPAASGSQVFEFIKP